MPPPVAIEHTWFEREASIATILRESSWGRRLAEDDDTPAGRKESIIWMMKQALPCPFCGGHARLSYEDYGREIRLGCPCISYHGCWTPWNNGATPCEDALRTWNRRATTAANAVGTAQSNQPRGGPY